MVLRLGTSEPTPIPPKALLEELAKTDNERVKEQDNLDKEKETRKDEEREEAERACLPQWKEFQFGKIIAAGSGKEVHPVVKQLQHYPGVMNMLSGIMMNLGNYPGDRASQEMITKYKEMHSAAERVANLTYQTEMARAQLQATHLDYIKACMNFEMHGTKGEAK